MATQEQEIQASTFPQVIRAFFELLTHLAAMSRQERVDAFAEQSLFGGLKPTIVANGNVYCRRDELLMFAEGHLASHIVDIDFQSDPEDGEDNPEETDEDLAVIGLCENLTPGEHAHTVFWGATATMDNGAKAMFPGIAEFYLTENGEKIKTLLLSYPEGAIKKALAPNAISGKIYEEDEESMD